MLSSALVSRKAFETETCEGGVWSGPAFEFWVLSWFINGLRMEGDGERRGDVRLVAEGSRLDFLVANPARRERDERLKEWRSLALLDRGNLMFVAALIIVVSGNRERVALGKALYTTGSCRYLYIPGKERSNVCYETRDWTRDKWLRSTGISLEIRLSF